MFIFFINLHDFYFIGLSLVIYKKMYNGGAVSWTVEFDVYNIGYISDGY